MKDNFHRSFNAASGNAIRATSKKKRKRLRLWCFNAASGNAIRATLRLLEQQEPERLVSMPQAAMLYARLGRHFNISTPFSSCNAASGNAIRATKIFRYPKKSGKTFQCRKRQCYTRDSVSRGPRNYWAQTEIFTTFPFFPRNGGIFRGHLVFKISENIMSPIDFQGLIVSTIFCCNLPCFSG